ncbi:hypothetical protein [Nocardiopsis alba]|uniref:hypothetical protein n=1 Tax=Nocardiopsis alba TaxID=53437 RepID=UPI0033A3B246
MASSTGHPAPVSKDIYWRRRAFVMIGVLLVLALIAYACRPSDGASETSSNQAAIEDPSASPSVPEEEPSEGRSEEPEEEPSASASPSEEPSEDAGKDDDEEKAEDEESEESGEAAAPESPEDACRPQDVVVTFDFAEKDRDTYGGGAGPGFKVTVVNIAEQTCTVDVGPEAVELIIHSGNDRIFSTADCAEGKREKQQLTQGRPYEYTLDWDRNRSFTDCRDSSAKAQPGWYKANLKGDHVGNVDQLVFQLQ